MIVGACRTAWRIQPSIPVTVDLPLVPPTAIPVGAALNRPESSSARVIRRQPSSLARTISGTLSSIAAEATRTCSAEMMPLPSCGNRAMPLLSSQANFSGVRPWSRLRSDPATSAPRPLRIIASGSIPDPPIPQKNQGLGGGVGQALRSCRTGMRLSARGTSAARKRAMTPHSHLRARQRRSPASEADTRPGAGGGASFPASSLSSIRSASHATAISPGHDAERLAALLECANDPAFDAVWFAKGGYGSNRIAADAVAQIGRGGDASKTLSRLFGLRLPARGALPARHRPRRCMARCRSISGARAARQAVRRALACFAGRPLRARSRRSIGRARRPPST